jgi:hypothetical protein
MDDQVVAGSHWRHIGTGHVYEVIALAKMDADCAPVVVYRIDLVQSGAKSAASLSVWVRPLAEFLDRFRAVRL